MNKYFILLLALMLTMKVHAQSMCSVSITLTDRDNAEPIVLANCVLEPLMAIAATGQDGKAIIKSVPQGRYTLKITYIGYESYTASVNVDKDVVLQVQLTPTSLALAEVNVNAKHNEAGQGTSSSIGRQAIDHLQASSLVDVMQLIPGQIIENTDLTQQKNIQIRQLVNDNTSAFGASIVVDGVPMSNNATLTQGSFSSTEFAGTDLRQVSADDIEKVEAVRGVPSAEFGDLTSGLVVVKTKIGTTPWQIKAKVTPQLINASVSKGLKMGRKGVLNFFADYAQAYSDPRYKTRSFHRFTGSMGYSRKVGDRLHTETRLRFSYSKDWSGNDPDAIDDGTKNETLNMRIALSHTGKIDVARRFARNISYTLSFTASPQNSENTSYVSASSGLVPIITATQTGYHAVDYATQSYLATGRTESRPYSFFVKGSDNFNLKSGPIGHRVQMGLEYHIDWNAGRGYYNVDETRPLRPNSNGRPRAFNDVPALHQFAFYAEDNVRWQYSGEKNIRLQAGVRVTMLQPWNEVRTSSVSPRINLNVEATEWLALHGGFGMNSKTPGLSYLYPDKKYTDRVAVNYMPQDDEVAQLLVYHTYVYDVKYTKGLKNATNTKIEAGFELKLPEQRRLDITGYKDKTPDGFGAKTEYITYEADYFNTTSGLIITNGQATQIDYSSPARRDVVWTTTGAIGNNSVSENYGLELDADLGTLRPILTTFNMSGAWQQTKTWSRNINTSNPVDNPTSYSSIGTAPFKVVYPSALDYSRYRQCVVTLRTITHVPSLRLVASLTAQLIAHSSTLSYVAPKKAIAWITPDLTWHTLTDDMQDGYIGEDGNYYDVKPTNQESVSVASQSVTPTDNQTITQPRTWQLSGRLTKEFGRNGSLSFYANNMLYYEPYRSSSSSGTLSQRNTSSFSFGAELSVKF